MKKLMILTSAACLGLAGTAIAKDVPEPLADVLPSGCSFVQIAPYGTSLLASWDWEDGTSQTKFGGDAEFMVSASPDGGANWYDFEVEFELEAYVPGTSPDDYAGMLVYRCSNAVTASTGSCNGSVLGVRDAILAAAADYLSVDPVAIGGNISATLEGVTVKAMNPGKDNGNQNFEKVDVCEEPI